MTAIAVAILLLTVLTISRSEAAFTAQTSNPENSFETGTVLLSDDDDSSSMFTATGLSPLNPVEECIVITYEGTLVDASVKMYGAVTDGDGLEQYLNLVIEQGSGGNFDDCSGFASNGTIYNGTLQAFATSYNDWSDGLNVFTATATGQSRTLRFTVTVADDNAAQNLSSEAQFVWESQEV